MNIFYYCILIYLSSALALEAVLKWQLKNVTGFQKFINSGTPVRYVAYKVMPWIPGLNTYDLIGVCVNFVRAGLSKRRFKEKLDKYC